MANKADVRSLGDGKPLSQVNASIRMDSLRGGSCNSNIWRSIKNTTVRDKSHSHALSGGKTLSELSPSWGMLQEWRGWSWGIPWPG